MTNNLHCFNAVWFKPISGGFFCLFHNKFRPYNFQYTHGSPYPFKNIFSSAEDGRVQNTEGTSKTLASFHIKFTDNPCISWILLKIFSLGNRPAIKSYLTSLTTNIYTLFIFSYIGILQEAKHKTHKKNLCLNLLFPWLLLYSVLC